MKSGCAALSRLEENPREDISELRALEANCAVSYFHSWVGVPIKWGGISRRPTRRTGCPCRRPRKEGYYADERIHVAIHDGESWETERLRRCATIGLGRTLVSRLTDGIGWKALCVNTHSPLFWFLGRANVNSMADLRGRRLAAHAAHTAPGCFARLVLRNHGLDPVRDLQRIVWAPGDTRWTCGVSEKALSTPA